MLPMAHPLHAPSAAECASSGSRIGRDLGTFKTSQHVEMGVLLGATALLYLWAIDRSGWANSYYSAAVQAGTASWKAFLFGSLDAGNALTVDKPPLALWPMELSARTFGLSPASLLVPQALEGLLAVWLLAASVRRASGSPRAGLLAGALFALTPVATLMFRYNNPDAMLTVLLVGAACATLRALEGRRPVLWLVVAGTLVGMGFLTKMLEAFLVLPALALTYLLFASPSLPRKLLHLIASLAALTVSAGWWVALVGLWPAAARPYVGGSSTNSVVELALGYNGVARLLGSTTVSTTSAGTGTGHVGRIWRSDLGAEVMWLLPAALVLALFTLVALRRSAPPPGTSAPTVRASVFLWLVWLLVSGVTFVAMAGTSHSYYTVVMAPAIAALTSIGARVAWHQRRGGGRLTLAVTSASTTVLSVGLLLTVGHAMVWAAWPVAALGILAVTALVRERAALGATATMAFLLLAAIIGPAAVSLSTAGHAHVGNSPMAGPDHAHASTPAAATVGAGDAPRPTPDVEDVVTRMLRGGADGYPWSAATFGARSAASYELASGTSIVGLGGYKGTDPAPTLAVFRTWVRDGRIHYLLPEGTIGAAGDAIGQWVGDHYTRQLVGTTPFYDLTATPHSPSTSTSTVTSTSAVTPAPAVRTASRLAQVPGRFSP